MNRVLSDRWEGVGSLPRIRVLVLTSLYPPHCLGGYELACRDVVERWRDAGHDVTVLTSSVQLPNEPQPLSEEHVHRRLRLLWNLPPGLPTPRRSAQPFAVTHNHVALRRCLREARPDVISVWHFGGLHFSLLRELQRSAAPVVYVVCDYWPEYAPDADPTSRWPIPRWGGPRATDAAVFCSTFLRDHLATSLPRAETFVAPLGVDPRDFPFSAAPIAPWRWQLLYVGRVEPAKGIETLVRALGALPSDAVLDVVGRGDVASIARVKGVAAAAGAEARLRLSSSARENLADRYAAADAVVFPSEWNEPFGIVPLEAMACGTPVVATGTGGSGEYLRDSQNCLLVPPGSATALGQALHRLASDPGLRSRLIQGGRVTAEALTTDRLAAALQDIHKEHSLARQAAPRNRGATVRRRDGGHDAVQL